LGAAVVAVLAELRDEDAGPAALLLGELVDLLADAGELLVVVVGAAVHTGDPADHGAAPAEHLRHRVGGLADRRAGAPRLARQLEQVAVAGCAVAQRVEGLLHALRVALRLQLREAGELLAPDLRVVDLAYLDRRLVGEAVLVDTDDRLVAA